MSVTKERERYQGSNRFNYKNMLSTNSYLISYMISFVFSIKDASPSLIRFLATLSGCCIIVTTELSLGTSLFSNNLSMIVVAIRSCTHVKYC